MDSKPQLYFFLTILSLRVVSACLDGECRELVFPSFFFFANKRLENHNITTVRVRDVNACELRCYHEPNCVSINFNYTASAKGTHRCDLNNATHRGHDKDLVHTEGYFYRGQIACDRAHCDNGGTCQSGFTDKGYRCLCPLGFMFAHCKEDVNECASGIHDCSHFAVCNNTRASYNCICRKGFTGDGYNCTDIDECATGTHNCSNDAVCNNTKGGFNCTCKSGFTGDGQNCTDTDECSTNSHGCDVNAACNNTKGSYTCACNSGYLGDGKTCTDIDECASGLHSCHSSRATCTNTVGSYSCSCDHPYTGDGRTCNLVSECQNYYSLNSTDRKITYTTSPFKSYCDMGMTHGWYRFEGAAGKRMAPSCPPTKRCNTIATGWLKGGHPNVSDGEVSRTVCFHHSDNCCQDSTIIQVRNCSSFYVYYLSGTPGCNFRFCGSD